MSLQGLLRLLRRRETSGISSPDSRFNPLENSSFDGIAEISSIARFPTPITTTTTTVSNHVANEISIINSNNTISTTTTTTPFPQVRDVPNSVLVHQTQHDFYNKTQGHGWEVNDPIIPLPDWPTALKEWGVWWEIHIFGTSVLFLFLTILSVAIFIKFRARVRRFQIVLNTLVLLATSGVFRAVFMLVDPYGYQNKMAGLMVGIMTQGVYPLLCACYGLTQVMLIRVTNVDVGPTKLRSLSSLLGCTLTYLFLVVVIETMVFYERWLKLLLLLDSGCFIAWSLYLSITFICSGFRLTQYTSETKKARKELNAFSNQRRSASNHNAVNAITANDRNDPSVLAINSGQPNLDSSLEVTSSLDTSNPVLMNPSNSRPNTALRLSRPKLKVSDRQHMTITIVTDDDDQSTSSTDVDKNPVDLSFSKAQKKKLRHKKQRHRSNPRSLVKTIGESRKKGAAQCEIALIDSPEHEARSSDECAENRKELQYVQIPLNDDQEAEILTNERKNNCDSSEANSAFPLLEPHRKAVSESAASTPIDVRSVDDSNENNVSCEMELVVKSMEIAGQKSESCENGFENENDHCVTRFSDMHCEELSDENQHSSSAKSPCTDNATSSARVVDSESKIQIGYQNVNDNKEPLGEDMHIQRLPGCAQEDESLNLWGKENGYLADTENMLSHTTCCAGNEVTNSRGKPSDNSLTNNNESSCPCQSSTFNSDSDSVHNSPVMSESVRAQLPAAVGLFRIRQSKMVQRAVHLTYFLTFLFMFACLLQLYTVFGVYGVLGTIHRPDPWPWLMFHTIYRLTEGSIGVTIAAIVFIALNHRHQRAKRRHMQQKQQQHNSQHHPNATYMRDCVV